MTRTHWNGAALAVLALAGGLAAAAPAEAGWRCGPYGRCVHRPGINPGAAVALGVVGGVALGAAIVAGAQPVYAAPAPVYLAPPPPACVTRETRVWNGWNWEVRSRQICR